MISNVLALTHHGPLAAIAILSNRGSRHLKPCALVPKSAKSEIKNASVVTPFYTLTFAQATKKTLPSLRHWLRTLPQHEVQAEPVSLLDAVHASAWATPKSAYGVWKPSAVCTVNAVDIQLDFESPEPPEVPLYQPRTVVVRNPRWHVPGTTEVAVSVPVMNFDIGLLLNRMLGSGGEFTTGGPGQGSLSLLAVHSPVGYLSLTSFLEPTTDGLYLLGIDAITDKTVNVESAVTHLTSLLNSLSSCSKLDLKRAAAQATLALMLEEDDPLLRAIQTSMRLINNDHMALADRIRLLNEVDLNEVQSVAREIEVCRKAVVVVVDEEHPPCDEE
ncbi:MAG: uncharacterized protein KVP18_003178 [Porospora cf. gigantea A]|uniref:uncharacterized protein n=3 Tax=Porospora cf. gigantea A TaxID=2853593 RepID=UPI0035599172|nr:MAG: hypothetical protein KVP18_003178 [Porospora cf. gigantea A]